VARYVSTVGGLFNGFGLTTATLGPAVSSQYQGNVRRLHQPMTAWRPRDDAAVKAALPLHASRAVVPSGSIVDWSTCGGPNQPPCNQGYAGPQAALQGLSSFGAVFGCSSFQLALGRLNTLLDQYKSANLDTSNGDYVAASNFSDQYGEFSLNVIWSNDDCTTVTTEAQTHINNLAALLGVQAPAAAPSTDVTTGSNGGQNLPQAPQSQGLLDQLKPVLIAAAVIAGAVVVAPIAWSFFVKRKAVG